MNDLGMIINWFIGILVLLFILFNLLAGHYRPTIPLALIVLLVLPPVRSAIQQAIGLSLPGWVCGLTAFVLFIAYVVILFRSVMMTDSVFKSPEVQTAMMAIYDAKLAQWPVPYETTTVETTYGDVFVVISGPKDAPPMMLLHASAMSNWSWGDNVEALSRNYRTYAIDTIGEANRSVLKDATVYPNDAESLANLYVEITDALGIDRAFIVGASFGGFIATNYALHYPERVEKVALLGPMGMTPATAETALRIMFVQCYPLQRIQDSTVRWALGENSHVLEASKAWFGYVVSGVLPREMRPRTFTPEQLQSLQVPVLLIIGSRDSLTGDPEKVRELAENTPDITLHVLDSGHLIGIEKAEQVNEMIPAFFAS